MNIVINTIVTLALGIPGVIVAGISLLLMLFALVRKEPPLMLLAALFAIPATYVSGSWADWGGIFMRLMPLFAVFGSYAIAQDDTLFSWVLPMPVLGYLIFYLFQLVLSSL